MNIDEVEVGFKSFQCKVEIVLVQHKLQVAI
jgi:hypothetical protein